MLAKLIIAPLHPFSATTALVTCWFKADTTASHPPQDPILTFLGTLLAAKLIIAQHPCSATAALVLCWFKADIIASHPPQDV
jgi:hypothetical protein